jgi:hypothetical protein
MAHRTARPSRMASATLLLLTGCATATEQTPAQKHAYAVYERAARRDVFRRRFSSSA